MNVIKTKVSVLVSIALISGCSESFDSASTESKQRKITTEDALSNAHEQQMSVESEMDNVSTLTAIQEKQHSVRRLQENEGALKLVRISREGEYRHSLPVHTLQNDNYLKNISNQVKLASTEPLSTFSVDVDTGSYANVRSMLKMGQRPPKDSVREEAFINYFDYQYSKPEDRSLPFTIYSEIAPAPWNDQRKLVQIALAGYDIPKSARKPSNLVFLLDVSGSMNAPNKLPLLVQSLSLMVNELTDSDTVSIVTYAGSTEVVLTPTKGNDKETIIQALRQLSTHGGTHGESGIKLAYAQAKKAFIKDGVNRIILATDGDFNVGQTNLDSLKEMIERQREQGTSLTTLGFGRGNYNDAMMEQLANIGNGNHAYIDTLQEANKVLNRQMSGTLQTIAKDVKIQVEFNPSNVKEYRLIGYQNRVLDQQDFNNDRVDAGEIGVGHAVTALYELTLTNQNGEIDDLKYQQKMQKENQYNDELMTIKVRYKLPEEETSQQITKTVMKQSMVDVFAEASSDFQFASAVAAFSQKLKQDKYTSGISFEEIADIGRKNRGLDPFNYRGEFVSLVALAETM